MSVISITHLTRDFGNAKGVFDLSLSIEKGEVFGFLGPNGAGKTTTIRHLMGFIRPQQGTCKINGLDCWRNAATVQRDLGYIPGEIALFPEMDGHQYLRFIQKYRSCAANNRLQELLDRFELNPKGKIQKMSKGTKQKLGIVSAFLHDPSVLILDEPTSGLDPLMQNRFIELIEQEKKRGKTIFMSSHLFEEVERTCQRVGMIRAGKLITVDHIEHLRQRHVRTYHVALQDIKTATAFARDFHGTIDTADPCCVTLTAQQTLEEIFLHDYSQEELS